MAKVKGRDAVRQYLRQIPDKLERKILRGAAKAAATVIADEAKLRVVSSEVESAIKISTRQTEPGRVVAKVQVKGPGAYIAPWLEYGTDPHFISVAEDQRDGRSVRRINQQTREAGGDGSLVIGGKFVGKTVWHPGARPHPFLRPALDSKEAEAIAAAQTFINSKIASHGLNGPEIPEVDE